LHVDEKNEIFFFNCVTDENYSFYSIHAYTSDESVILSIMIFPKNSLYTLKTQMWRSNISDKLNCNLEANEKMCLWRHIN